MKTLLLTTDLDAGVGGIQTCLTEIQRRMAPEGCVTLQCSRPPAAARVPARVLNAVSPLLGEAVSWYPRASRMAADHGTAIVQCGHIRVAFIAYLLSRRRGIPYVVYAHGNEVCRKGRAARGIFDRIARSVVLRHADGVLTLSDYTSREVLKWGVPSERITLVSAGGDPYYGEPCSDTGVMAGSTKGNGKRLLSVGRLVERKGHDTVLRSLPVLVRRFPELIYTIVGDGPAESRLRDLASELGVKDSVKFAGRVPRSALPAFYDACDVFVLPCATDENEGDVEGLGLVFLEANAFGKPVIGARGGGVGEAVLDGVTGMLIDADDEAGCGAAIERLFTDVDYARELGTNGRERVRKRMNWDRTASDVAAVLERITGK